MHIQGWLWGRTDLCAVCTSQGAKHTVGAQSTELNRVLISLHSPTLHVSHASFHFLKVPSSHIRRHRLGKLGATLVVKVFYSCVHLKGRPYCPNKTTFENRPIFLHSELAPMVVIISIFQLFLTPDLLIILRVVFPCPLGCEA